MLWQIFMTQNQNKKKQKLSLDSFYVGHLLSLSMGCIPREALLEKKSFSFASAYLLEVASALPMETSVYFLAQCWDSGRQKMIQTLCTLPLSL